MAGQYHWCNEHELGQTPGDGEGQGGLACCRPWGCKESDTTGRLNNNNIHSHKSGRILANILTLVVVEKILVNFNFTFLGICIVFYFIFYQKERKKRGWECKSEYHIRKYAVHSAGTGESLKILKGKTELTKYEPSRTTKVGGPWWLTLFLFPQNHLPCATCRPRSQACRLRSQPSQSRRCEALGNEQKQSMWVHVSAHAELPQTWQWVQNNLALLQAWKQEGEQTGGEAFTKAKKEADQFLLVFFLQCRRFYY